MIELAGGDGTSKANAIIILNARNSIEGVHAEYAAVEAMFGKKGIRWELQLQQLQHDAFSNRHFDVLEILYQKEVYRIWFDITEFFGKS